MLPKIQKCQVKIFAEGYQNPKNDLFYGNWLPKAEIFYSSVQKTQNCNLDLYLKT